MARSQLADFLEGAASKPYRDLIEYHLKRQSTAQLQQGALGESTMLPENLQPSVMGYIDAANTRFGYDKQFWETATCQSAFESIVQLAIEVMPLAPTIASVTDALRIENHELAFQLFQIPTLSLAYSASTQRAQRKFMGIRKGLFG